MTDAQLADEIVKVLLPTWSWCTCGAIAKKIRRCPKRTRRVLENDGRFAMRIGEQYRVYQLEHWQDCR